LKRLPDALYYLAFDENGSDGEQNRVDTLLLGTAVPKHLVGTQDTWFYTHYSEIATVEANWNLHTLGRYDVGANVFSFVAEKTGDVMRTLENPPLSETFLNASYPGIFNTAQQGPMPVPNVDLVVNHRSVLPKVKEIWGSRKLQACTTYHGRLEIPSLVNPPVLPPGCVAPV